MGMEASCLVPSSTGSSCAGPCTGGMPLGSACCVPGAGGSCMETRDARSVSAKPIEVNTILRGGGSRHGAALAGGRTGGLSDFTEPVPFRPPLPLLPPASCCGGTTGVQLEVRFGSAEEARKAARHYVKEDRAHEAFATYSSALELDEDSAPLCDEFGQFLFAHNQLEGAEYLFTRALVLDPLNAEYCYRRGVVLQQRKQPAEAAEAFATALRQDPRFVGAHFNLGITHRELGEYSLAAEDFRKILQIDSENHCALAMLGECLAEIGDHEGAVQSLEEAVRLDPTNRAAQKDLTRMREAASQAGQRAPRAPAAAIAAAAR